MKKIKLGFLTYVLVSVTRIVILMNNLKDCLCTKSLIYDSVVTCDETVDMQETATIGSVNKKGYCLPYTIFLLIVCQFC